MKKDIRHLSQEEFAESFALLGLEKFRAKQVHEWLWKKSAKSFDEMTNLSKSLRDQLKENFAFENVNDTIAQISTDGTVKLGIKLADQRIVEGVMIPDKDRTTACVSSQVGCTLSCSFCATGFLKRERNLTAAEIYDQVVLINQQSNESIGRNLSNIVFMGMGEP